MSQSKLYVEEFDTVDEAYLHAADQYAVAKAAPNCIYVGWLPSAVVKALNCSFGVNYITKTSGLHPALSITVAYKVKNDKVSKARTKKGCDTSDD